MSKLITNTFRHTGGSADNITLDASQNVTVEGNLTVDGTTVFTGDCTLPDDTVDIADLSATGTASSSTFLRGDNSWAAAGGGKVLQYKYAIGDLDDINMTTTSWHEVDSDIQIDITPTATNNLIMAYLFVNPTFGNNESGAAIPVIYDGSNNISMIPETDSSGGLTAANVLGGTGPAESIRNTNASAWYKIPMTIIGKHTAANTNEHTVKFYGKFLGWDNGITFGDNVITSQLVVMEIDMS